MAEDNGVLGNLPRSRPGTRSAKREEGAGSRAPRKPASAAEGSGRAAATARRATARRATAAPRPKAPPRPAPQPADPVGEAVRTAAKVAGAGLKLADGMTRELLRRLPKP